MAMKCGICQRNTIRNSAAPPVLTAAVRRRPPDERGSAPGTAPTSVASGRPPFHRRINDEIDHERREGERRGLQVHQHPEQHEARGRQDQAEHAGVECRDAAVGQRPHPGPPHQRVGVALVDLVERGRAPGHKRRAHHGGGHMGQVQRAGRAQVVTGRARRDDEHVEPAVWSARRSRRRCARTSSRVERRRRQPCARPSRARPGCAVRLKPDATGPQRGVRL